jgi:hypothetical protein
MSREAKSTDPFETPIISLSVYPRTSLLIWQPLSIAASFGVKKTSKRHTVGKKKQRDVIQMSFIAGGA